MDAELCSLVVLATQVTPGYVQRADGSLEPRCCRRLGTSAEVGFYAHFALFFGLRPPGR